MKPIVFRFCVIYFGLYAAATQILGGVLLLPGFQLPAFGNVWPLRDLTLWAAQHVFGLTPPLVYTGNSGDTAFHWVQTALLLTIATTATAIWSALARWRIRTVDGQYTRTDRRKRDRTDRIRDRADLRQQDRTNRRQQDRTDYRQEARTDQHQQDRTDNPTDNYPLRKWFRLVLRFALAAQMFYYGMAKIIPTQFPPPGLVTLIEPVGSASLSDLLWTFIGASTSYQVMTGGAEMTAGLLLLTPQTTTLGALIGLLDMTQVFLLNMTYDFGLKQISFHLLLMFVFLLAPDFRRLANVLVLNRAAAPSSEPPLFATARANRIALAAQLIIGLYLIVMFGSLSTRYFYADGGPGAPRSPLYGIWNVEQLSIDDQVRPAVMNDYDRRWRRVIFDTPNVVVFQRTDDSLAHFGAALADDGRTLALTKRNSRTWSARFEVERPSHDRLILVGDMDRYRIRMQLRLVELDTFRLLRSTFRWIRPPDPFAG
ncbi:MAG TPA: hypothetical protein VGF24_10515 [Vicinamibacterales bacterium]